jgi:UDP-2,4-diacetamido-2,4,6-trideoxy-beta-L-altropyranose hydrolase
MMQLFFRVEGSEFIGLGHLMRCFALSQVAQQANHEVVFICDQASKNFLLSRHQWKGEIVVIDDHYWNRTFAVTTVNEQNKSEIDFIATCMSGFDSKKFAGSGQILVIDGYQFDHAYQDAVSKAGIAFAYFDDINMFLQQNKTHLANVVINGAGSAHKLGYEKNTPNTRLCLGPQYLLLRSEFINVPLIPIVNRDSLLIFFGGADAENHTVRMLGALSQLKFKYPVKVVTGAAYKFQQQLVESIQNGWLNYDNLQQPISMPIQYTHDAQDMADIMSHSRLSVSAAGGAQFELMRCYTPSVLIVVADNQMPAASVSAQQGWCSRIDGRNKLDYTVLAKQVTADYDDIKSLVAMQKKAYEWVQSATYSGADNVLSAFNDVLNRQSY